MVDYSKATGGNFLYAHYDTLQETDNPWEYYFEPLSNMPYESGDSVHHTYEAGGLTTGYNHPKNYYPTVRAQCHYIINKYIKLKPHIMAKIEEFYQHNMHNCFTIGIHLRGTDKKSEVKQTDPMVILKRANKIAKKLGRKCQFLVATDEEKLLTLAQSTLRGKVLYYHATRSTNGLPIHYNAQVVNRMLLGEEVLIEAHLLSRCDVFIHTLTNVAQAISYLNPHLKTVLIAPRHRLKMPAPTRSLWEENRFGNQKLTLIHTKRPFYHGP